MTNPKYLYKCVRSCRTFFEGGPVVTLLRNDEREQGHEVVVACGSYEAMEAAMLLLNDCCELCWHAMMERREELRQIEIDRKIDEARGK